MTALLPPVPSSTPAVAAPAAGASLPGAAVPGTPVPGAAVPAAGAPAAPVTGPAPAPAAGSAQPLPPPPSATAVRWSPAMLQNLRLQAFEQLVAQLARQVQASPNAPAPQWPAEGVSEVLRQVLQALLDQVATPQGRPLQLLAAQPGSTALMQALVTAAKGEAALALPAAPQAGAGAPASAPVPASAAQATAPAPAQAPAAALASLAVAAAKASVADALQAALLPAPLAPGKAANPALPLPAAAAASLPASTPAPGAASAAARPAQSLPPLQNWWVQQGTLMTPQGERSFMLSLQVPQAWAQAQGAALALPTAGAPALPANATAPGAAAAGLAGALPAAQGWRLPLDVPLQALASGPVAVVLQPRDEPQLRTSALLLLEFQPLRQAQAQAQALPATPFTAWSPAMAQEMQQLLQNRSDPWLQMAVAQNAGALPRERSGHQSHLCTTAGCQYEGRAPCAQPFCSEMNRLWGVARAERRL